MAWLPEGLTNPINSLSSLKGQITSFTKEVLSDGIVSEIDDGRNKDLEEANAKCDQLQELLKSKEAEISLLRKQNSELQKAVVEFHSKPNDSRSSNGTTADEGSFFWDPQPQASRNREVKNQTKLLQDQLDQASVRIRDLEAELARLATLNSSNVKDDANFKEEGPSPKTELLRAKQDVMNRIIQIGEKSREVERNAKRLQQDEQTLVCDLRSAISKLASTEQQDLIRSALLALESESQESRECVEREKSDGGAEVGLDKSQKRGENERESELRRRIEELETENQGLSSAVEELDRQNAESIERVLSLKEELQKKHQSLQSAYEQLYVDYNQALAKIDELKQQAQVAKQAAKRSLDTAVQTFPTDKLDKQTEIVLKREDKDTDTTALQTKEDKGILTVPSTEDKGINVEVAEVTTDNELAQVREILKGTAFETGEESESLYVSLARQYAEQRWKQETLERRLTEQSRELKETQELRESLQLDCEDMQTNIESLLLEIQRLKSSLPSIPEASEERVASLETETESLQEEISRLRATNAGMTRELRALRQAASQAGIDVSEVEATATSGKEDEPAEMLRAAMEENANLRRRVDALESELRVALERAKGIDESLELIEELKLDLENARRELKILGSNNKRLEGALALLQEAKAEAEADNEVLAREKEQLEQDLKLMRDSSERGRDDGAALGELREQLARARDEKNDLEYDIMKMRQELDKALEELELAADRARSLEAENERLARENAKLTDQFAEAQNESQDKIEMLNTETSLLQQELDASREELVRVNERLKVTEQRVTVLQDENKNQIEVADRIEELEHEKQTLKRELQESVAALETVNAKLRDCEEKVEVEARKNSELTSKLDELGQQAWTLENERKQLELELEEKRMTILKDEEELGRLETKLKCAETYTATLESEHKLLEDSMAEMKVQLEESKSVQKQVAVQQETTQNLGEPQPNVPQELTENLKIMEEENRELKSKLERLVAERSSVESHKSETGLTEQERSQLEIQLAEKSKEIESLKKTIAKDKDSALMARETVENLSQLISAKDSEITKVNQAYVALSEERDKLVKLVQEKHAESLQYHGEIQRLTQLINEQAANLQKTLAERDANAAGLQDKEAQLLWTQNELQVIKQRLQNVEETSGHGERCGLPEHTLLGKKAEALEERNKALEAAVIQDQSNLRYLQEQLADAQSKEVAAIKEVERLRNHLVDIEANYTEEALQSEEIRNTLEARLLQAEEKLKNSSTMYTSANVRANQQVETLQQQLALMAQQRDDLQNKISAAEDKVLSYTASLTNLQLVLEQFQRDKEKDIYAATEKLRFQLQQSYKDQEALRNEILVLESQLIDARDALQAAARLTDELSNKAEHIEQLKQEVNRLTELVNSADQRIEEAKKSGEGKVDRTLVKNLLLGYISSPQNDKSSVLRVFANVLDFNESEREKSGLNGSAKTSWFASLANNGSSTGKEQETSLSTAFIKFLESESQPKPQLPALPISNSSISRPGHSRQHSSSSTQSILLSNVNLPTFPEFVPARNTGSILKEVLKDS